jgi:Gpi18-like mannosyltransferase
MAMFDSEMLRRHFREAHWKLFGGILALEILFSLILLHSPGTVDVIFAGRWIDGLLKNGLINGYRVNGGDYPPLLSIILISVTKIGAAFSLNIFLSFKISLAIAFLCTTLCFWGWTLDGALTGLLAFAIYLNAIGLGYTDTYFAPSLIVSLWALQQKKIALFSVLFAISCLIKWQPIIIAPFLVLHALSTPVGDAQSLRSVAVRRWFQLGVPSLVVVLGTVAAFGLGPIAAALNRALHHDFLSGNALNFNWLVTWFLRAFYADHYGAIRNGIVNLIHIDPSVGWARTIKLIFILTYLGAFWRLIKVRASFSGAIECCLVGYLSYFIFNIGVHENHLFLAAILAVIAAASAPDARLRAVLIVGISNLNLITFYGFTGAGLSFTRVVGVDVSIIFSAVNVLLFLFFWGELVLRGRGLARYGSAGGVRSVSLRSPVMSIENNSLPKV